MRVVARRGAEAAAGVLTREEVVEQAGARQRVRLTEQVQRREAPVDAVDAEVFGQVVFELIAALCGYGPGVSVLQCGPRSGLMMWRRTVSRLCMYVMCLSTTNVSPPGNVLLAVPPPRPGPAASDIALLGYRDYFLRSATTTMGTSTKSGLKYGFSTRHAVRQIVQTESSTTIRALLRKAAE